MHRKKRIGNIINKQSTGYNNTHFCPNSGKLIEQYNNKKRNFISYAPQYGHVNNALHQMCAM